MRFFIDLTTSRAYAGRPAVGIVRVEREIAKYYFEHDSTVEFFYCDNATQTLRGMSRDYVAILLGLTPIDKDGRDHQISVAGHAIKKGLATHVPVYGRAIYPHENDVLISAGLTWDQNSLSYIYKLKSIYNFKFVQIIYDVIPTIMPEYCVPEMGVKFANFILNSMWVSDVIFGISESTLVDLRAFCDKHKIEACRMERIILGSDISDRTQNPQIHPSKSSVRDILIPKNFVLYVSTIEPRKNHMMLFNIWREIYKEDPDVPPLVFVGTKGWKVDDLISYIELSSLYPSKLKILSGISDDDLHWLYRNCKFTVYPSLYEGWGLPVVESLRFKKICIASNCSSIPEAADGLCKLIEPYDYVQWSKWIKKYLYDQNLLASHEGRIATNFIPVDWPSSISDFDVKIQSIFVEGQEDKTCA